MTRLELKSRILDNVKDPNQIYWTDDKINLSIQDGYDEIVLETECIEGMYTLNSTPGLIYYDLYDLIPNFWKLTRIYNNQTNRWLTIYDQQVLNRVYFSWEQSTNTPWYGYIVDYRYFGFFPHANSSQTFDIYYKLCKDVLLSDSQQIQIQPAHIKVLETWCTADLLESVQEFSKAQVFWQDYNMELERFKAHVRARQQPVQRQILEPINRL